MTLDEWCRRSVLDLCVCVCVRVCVREGYDDGEGESLTSSDA